MKQVVVDAMTLADRQHSACLREAAAYFRDDNESETGRWYVKEGLWRDGQYHRFRAYILAHMTETPWLPVKGADDNA